MQIMASAAAVGALDNTALSARYSWEGEPLTSLWPLSLVFDVQLVGFILDHLTCRAPAMLHDYCDGMGDDAHDLLSPTCWWQAACRDLLSPFIA